MAELVAVSSSAEVASDLDPTAVLLTVEEAARRLRIGRTTCFKLVLAGEIESVMVGRLRRIPPEALRAYVAGLRRRCRSAAAA